jgi:hypothetical protein
VRKYKDKTGLNLDLFSITGEDAFSGMLEGSPYMVRKYRLLKANNMIGKKGVFYYGQEEIEQELSTLPKDTDIWPADERWYAVIGANNYLGGGKVKRERLSIHWYQQGENPMEKLQLIIEQLDFQLLCLTTEVEDDD